MTPEQWNLLCKGDILLTSYKMFVVGEVYRKENRRLVARLHLAEWRGDGQLKIESKSFGTAYNRWYERTAETVPDGARFDDGTEFWADNTGVLAKIGSAISAFFGRVAR